MKLPRLTVLLGLILIAIGLGFWLASGRESVTALIPAFLGVPIGLCGLWAHRESARKLAMHLALVFALLGFGGTVPGILKMVKKLSGEEIERPTAALAQSVVAVLCLVFLVIGIRSFVVARRNQQAAS